MSLITIHGSRITLSIFRVTYLIRSLDLICLTLPSPASTGRLHLGAEWLRVTLILIEKLIFLKSLITIHGSTLFNLMPHLSHMLT